MKKTKINLLSSRNDYQKYETYFVWIRFFSVFVGILFIFILIIFFVFILNQISTINQLTKVKKDLLVLLQNKEQEQANIILINDKYTLLQDYLKEDAKSLPYYTLLSNALNISSESGKLKSFTINKKRETTFSVGFENFNNLMSFFRFVESKTFLQNFERVSLKGFNAIQNTKDKKDNYEITFNGVFIKLDTE